MIAERRVVEERKLENGLTVYLYDLSKPIAGDRFQVQLMVHVLVEVREEYFSNCSDPKRDYEDFTAAFGPSVSFEQGKIRNFIDANKVPNVLNQMRDDIMKSNLRYLSKPIFPEKYVSKVFSEWKEKEALRMAHQMTAREVWS